MAKKIKKPKGFNLPFAGNEDYELGNAFLRAPETFLESLGLSFEDIECPPEAHKAFERAESFREALSKKKFKNNRDYLEFSQELASKYFGADFESAIIPFGVKFKERINMQDILSDPGGGTATASGTISFLDADADTDS